MHQALPLEQRIRGTWHLLQDQPLANSAAYGVLYPDWSSLGPHDS